MSASNLYKSSIWIIDDNPDHYELIMDVIFDVTEDYNIFHKFNGEVAYKNLVETASQSRQLPSLIIMDIKMPRMNGIETLTAIKKHPDLNGIPVVMLSTSTNQTEMDTCLQTGAILFITKPLSKEYFERNILPLINL